MLKSKVSGEFWQYSAHLDYCLVQDALNTITDTNSENNNYVIKCNFNDFFLNT